MHKTRLARLREGMGGVDAVLLTPGPDFFYLTGVSVYAGKRLLALIVPREGDALFVAPEMNVDQLVGVAGIREVRAWSDGEGYRQAAADALSVRGLSRATIAVDEEMRAAFLLDLQAQCPDIRWRGAGAVMDRLRIRKDRAELAVMERAARIADAAIPAGAKACRPGRTEEAVAADVRAAMEREGGPGIHVYGVIAASGPNGALPHHHTSARELAASDVVVLDFGCQVEGYHSDITVTLSLGPPGPEESTVYRTVWEAQARAIERIRPGVPAEEVDRAARETISRAGYGPAFLHRTGHGIGLQVHEAPYIVAGNRQPLEEGMCFSVEPGIYLPGRFGVRLEVIATVTADGVRLLNAPSSPVFRDVLA
jgi:Xaa-Pro aminopeptidase